MIELIATSHIEANSAFAADVRALFLRRTGGLRAQEQR